MITVTERAAAQINHSVGVSKAENMPLRIAVKKDNEGNFQYAMGFDELRDDSDQTFESSGVTLVYNQAEQEMLQGMTLDFVTLDDGQKNFVFLNPNDPAYTPPQED